MNHPAKSSLIARLDGSLQNASSRFLISTNRHCHVHMLQLSQHSPTSSQREGSDRGKGWSDKKLNREAAQLGDVQLWLKQLECKDKCNIVVYKENDLSAAALYRESCSSAIKLKQKQSRVSTNHHWTMSSIFQVVFENDLDWFPALDLGLIHGQIAEGDCVD